MKFIAAFAVPLVLPIALLVMVPVVNADDSAKVTTYCGHTTRVSADSASMKVMASSNKQPRGTMIMTVKRVSTGNVVRSMAASFAGAERTEFAFRSLPRGTYKVILSASGSRLFHGCSASERLILRGRGRE
jgi:hypothetical protein